VTAQDYLLWAKKIGGIGNFDYAFCIKKDLMGNIFILGTYSGTVDFDPNVGIHNSTAQGLQDAYLLKLDKNANFIWVKTFEGSSNSAINVNTNSIHIDKSGAIIINGIFDDIIDSDPSNSVNMLSAVHSYDMFLIKLDGNGNFIWSKMMNNRGSVNVDYSDNIIISGYFIGTTDMNPNFGIYNMTPTGNSDGYIIKLDSQGNFVYAKQIGGINTFIDNTYLTEIDKQNNIYLSGLFGGTIDFNPNGGVNNLTSSLISVSDSYILKLDSNCNFIWVKQITNSYFGEITNLKIDSNFNIYYSIMFQIGTIDLDPSPNNFLLTSLGSYDFAISKMDNNGTFVWGKHFGGNGIETAYSMELDQNDDILLCGAIGFDSVDLDPGLGVVIFNPIGLYDGYLLKLNSNGNYIYSKQFGGDSTSNFIPYSVIVDNNNLLLCGTFGGKVDFDPNTSVNYQLANAQDGFILKLSEFPLSLNTRNESNLQVYPNPVVKFLTLDNLENEVYKIMVFNSIGELIHQVSDLKVNKVDIDFSRLGRGEYFIKIYSKKQITDAIKVIIL